MEAKAVTLTPSQAFTYAWSSCLGSLTSDLLRQNATSLNAGKRLDVYLPDGTLAGRIAPFGVLSLERHWTYTP
jgi:hypothetical protein